MNRLDTLYSCTRVGILEKLKQPRRMSAVIRFFHFLPGQLASLRFLERRRPAFGAARAHLDWLWNRSGSRFPSHSVFWASKTRMRVAANFCAFYRSAVTRAHRVVAVALSCASGRTFHMPGSSKKGETLPRLASSRRVASRLVARAHPDQRTILATRGSFTTFRGRARARAGDELTPAALAHAR